MALIDSQFETKGTHLYFIDALTTTDPTVTKLTCPTSIPGLGGGTKDRIDTTCLDETGSYRTYVGGFADPQELTIPFILYDGDTSHKALFLLRDSGDVVSWMACLSDATSIPTLDSDMTALVTPADRTTFAFSGYVSQVTIDATINEVIRGTLSIQPTGTTTPYWPA
jgi:hypothetical protein